MDSIKIITNMVTRNCFMAAIDISDAYYIVSISKLFQKFLKFKQKDKLCYFICFLNGLGPCPRKLTKLNRVLIVTLHFKRVPLSGYVDEFFY